MEVGVRERRLDEAEQLVALAEQAHHEVVAGDDDLDLGDTHAGACDLTRLGTAPRYRTGGGRPGVLWSTGEPPAYRPGGRRVG